MRRVGCGYHLRHRGYDSDRIFLGISPRGDSRRGYYSQKTSNVGVYMRVCYMVYFTTECGENDAMRIDAVSEWDAEDEVRNYIRDLDLGLQGIECVSIEVREV